MSGLRFAWAWLRDLCRTPSPYIAHQMLMVELLREAARLIRRSSHPIRSGGKPHVRVKAARIATEHAAQMEAKP